MAAIRDRLEGILARLADPKSDTAHVFTVVHAAAARAAADAADARRAAGVSLGPLDGRIVSIKDLFDVAGETTTAGSRILKDAPPAVADAPVVARLRRAGAVIVGKTNMSEFAFSGIGINPHWGTPGNAADRAHVPGGSSSGAGVSAGDGTSEIAIGTDTGGSIRIPASLNGVVGFKPSTGRVPTDGAFPLSYTLDSVGPLAKSVADCAAADAVMAGEEPWALAPAPLAGLRIGVPRGRLFTETELAVAAAFEATLGRLSAAGARIVDIAIEDLLDAMAGVQDKGPIAAIEAASIHAAWLDRRAVDYDPRVRARILRGRDVPAPVFITMMRDRARLIGAFEARVADFDVLALPATPTTAPRIRDLVEAEDSAFARVNLLMLRNTMVGNFFDVCGISLPMPGTGRMPAGLMLMAPHGRDRHILRIAAGVEALLAA